MTLDNTTMHPTITISVSDRGGVNNLEDDMARPRSAVRRCYNHSPRSIDERKNKGKHLITYVRCHVREMNSLKLIIISISSGAHTCY
jgi:hypothetical protein